MNETKNQDALVREYLRSLGWALRLQPAPERETLMAEVTEHIALARAELEDPTTESVQAVLDRMGPPDTIATEATRLADEAAAGRTTWHQEGFADGSPAAIGLLGFDDETSEAPGEAPAPRRQSATRSTTIGFWADLLVHPPSGPAPAQDAPADWELHTVGLLLAGGLLAGVGWLLGAVRLWRSEVFTLPDKVIGTALLPGGILPAIVLLIWPIGGSGGLARLAGFGVCGAIALGTSLYLRHRLQAFEVHSGFESFRARRAAHADERSRNEVGLQ